ncbi:MAG: hypothetical protein VKI81_04235 [Synechococcaceae cyanobacterium]|nr:hypothetical protein [Synechococcaceae cyanobacterium]
MQRPSFPWIWILLPLLILLLPGPVRGLLLDLLGGLTLTLLLLPLLLGGAALIGWQILRRRLRTCQVCGFSSLGSPLCPSCGTPFPQDGPTAEVNPANVTINVEAVDVEATSVEGPELPQRPPR